MNKCKDKKIIKSYLTDWHKLTRIKGYENQCNSLDLQRKNKGRKKHLPLQELTRGER